jgi:DNA-binding transcriptional LysR family regulator
MSWSWPFANDERELKVRPQGQMAFNTITLALDMVAGLGLAYPPQDIVSQHLATGELMQALADWSPPASGYHLYYQSRRQQTPAFALLLDAVRYRG